MSWAQLLLWRVLLSFASWASILFAINTSESHRAAFECDTSEIMSEIDAGFSSCMILDLEDVLHNFEMVMPVPPVVRETHPSARAVVLESGIETFFYRLGLVLDSLVFGLGLRHRTRQMF